MIRISLIDDQELVRTGLRTLAEKDGDIEVIAEASDGRSGLSIVRHCVPDIVLMDIRMPVMDGITATEHIVADPALRSVKVIILTTFDEDEDIVSAIRAGATGYLLKDIAPADLRTAIRTVSSGDALLSPTVTTKVLRQLSENRPSPVRPELLQTLTEREREVLAQVGKGESNQEIARSLHLSPDTARTYVSRLLSKLETRDRAGLVVLAYESGLVVPGGSDPGSTDAGRGVQGSGPDSSPLR